jgi:signal transduction histidine kinase/ligand-binding sensor domain-containing protein/DNA-binding response OmpR family regulator
MRYVLVLMCFTLLSHFCIAEKLKIISVKDGMSGSKVFSMVEDENGIMYFGTDSGLDRYDGTNFTHFNYPEENVSFPFRTQVFYDKNKNLWLGNNSGLFQFDFNQDKIIVPQTQREQLKLLNIRVISSDHYGRLWLGTDNSLCIYDYEKDLLINISELPFEVNSIEFINANLCLVGTSDGIFQVDINNLNVGVFLSSENIFRDSQCSFIKKDSLNRIWICSLSKGIFIYDGKKDVSIRLLDNLDKIIPPETVIKDIYQTSKDRFLIATDGSGLFVLNEQLELVQHRFHNENDPESLSSNGIYDIYVDSNNRTWLCTYGGGINIIDPNNPSFGILKHIVNEQNSLGNNFARTIIEDSKGNIWVGTRKGISILSKQNGRWKHIYNSPESRKILGNNTTLTLCQVTETEIWAGSYGGGIDKININTLKVEPLFSISEFKERLGAPFVYSIKKDSKGEIWIAMLKSNIARYNLQTKKITHYPFQSIHSIAETSNNQLFLGSGDGLTVINLNDETYKIYQNTPGDKSTISNNTVYSFHELNEKEVMVGTGRGLNIFNLETRTFKYYTQKNGLASDDIRSIIKDAIGNYWLGTTSGLSVFDINKEEFTNYENSDGIQISEFNYGSACTSSDGLIYFGGYNGIIFLEKGQFNKTTIVPEIFFTDFKIFNKTVSPSEKDSPLQGHINQTETINLKSRENSISFSFIGVNYSNPLKNNYSWKLEGFDETWVPTSQIPVATYTNLEPGSYTLKVKATNLSKQWNSKERAIQIIIAPPFWETYWAYTFYTIIMLGISFFILKFTKIQYEEKHSKEKINFFTQLAHDLRTSLTLIKSPLSRIHENNNLDKSDKEMLDLSQKNLQKLTQRFNQLLDFQKADLNKLQLQINRHDFIDHLNEAIVSFKPILESKKIEFEIKNKFKSLDVWYDKIKIDKVLLNLLSNAVKYTTENGKITIKCNTSRKYWNLEVCDNGIGIPKNQHNRIFNQYFRASNAINSSEVGSGVGLMLVKKIVDLHKGKISFNSELNEGTCFKIMIPLNLQSKTVSNEKVSVTEEISPSKPILPLVIDNKIEINENSHKSSKRAKVLVTEDSDELRNFLIQSLQDDYVVSGAANGKEGLKIVKTFHPDIIISDIMMPKMDGNTFCSKLKNDIETCHIPVILLTALTDSFFKIEGYHVGADDYIEKPFDIGILKSRIENLISSRKMLKDKFLKFIAPNKGEVTIKNNIDQIFLEKAVQLVNDNLLNTEFSVNELSKNLNVSRPVLYRKIKALTDQSPQEFIKVIRLQKAAEILRTKDSNIGETAYLTGFANPKHFSTSFKQHFGMSPSKFIQQKSS